MIVGATLCVTYGEPAAYVAMLARFWIGVLAVAVIAHFFEPRLYIAIVGRVFRKAIGFRFEFLATRNDIHEFRSFALELRQQRRIQSELKDGCGFCFASQLAVVYFVRPVSQTAFLRNFAQ